MNATKVKMGEAVVKMRRGFENAKAKIKMDILAQARLVNNNIADYLCSSMDYYLAETNMIPLRKLCDSLSEKYHQMETELCLVRAIDLLVEAGEIKENDELQWCSLQADNGTEPELSIFRDEKCIMSCVITGLKNPTEIDLMITNDLAKLNEMAGQKIHFVITKQMKRMAETEIKKEAYDIRAISLRQRRLS